MVQFIVRKSEVAELTRIMTKAWTERGFPENIAADLKSLNEQYTRYAEMRKQGVVRRIVNLLSATSMPSLEPIYRSALSLLTTAEDCYAQGVTTVGLRGYIDKLREEYQATEAKHGAE